MQWVGRLALSLSTGRKVNMSDRSLWVPEHSTLLRNVLDPKREKRKKLSGDILGEHLTINNWMMTYDSILPDKGRRFKMEKKCSLCMGNALFYFG